MLNFVFPSQLPESIRSIHEIKAQINAEMSILGLSSYCSYSFREIKKAYLYCRCNYCSAELVFRKSVDSQQFHLTKAQTSHSHKPQIPKKAIVINAINQIPINFQIGTIRKLITQRFNISSATFYRHYNEARYGKESFEQTYSSLKKLGFFGFYPQLSSQLPEVLLLTSESMKQRYLECGGCCSFDLTFNLIRERPKIQNSQYTVGVILGLSSSVRIQPFCLVITASETKTAFASIFQQFFRLMDAVPNVIMTDEQKTLSLAIDQLKLRPQFSEIYHFLDAFHILKNIKKKLFDKTMLNNFVNMIHAENKNQFSLIYNTTLSKIDKKDEKILKDFVEKSHLFSFGMLPPVFIGFSSSTSPSQKINDLIKTQISMSQPYCVVMRRLAIYLDEMSTSPLLPEFDRLPLQTYLPIPSLIEIKKIVCKKIFQRIVKQFSKSATCLISILNGKEYEISDGGTGEESFFVHFDSTRGKWTCSCQYQIKTGIPCCHLIKVLLYKQESFKVAVNPHWILERLQKTQYLLPRPRKTRRSQHY